MQFESVDEILNIARKTGVSVQLCHVKITGKQNYGKARIILDHVDKAIDDGIDVWMDAYPYTAGMTSLHYIFPSWVTAGTKEDIINRLSNTKMREKVFIDSHDSNLMSNSFYTYASPENIVITAGCKNEYLMKSLAEIAKIENRDPIDSAIDMIINGNDDVTMSPTMQDQDELDSIIAHKFCLIGSDGFTAANGNVHPRWLGTFAKILDYYVKEKRILSLEEAVSKMTGRTAARFRIDKRGNIREGYYADAVLIDWSLFNDRTTFDSPLSYSDGINSVFINGKCISKNGRIFDRTCHGMLIRKS